MRDIRHFIDGAAFDGASGRFGDVFNPNTGEVQARVQLATVSEMDRAVQSAQAAFEGWASTNPQRRARVMFEFKRLVEANMNELAELLSSEHGKVIADSKGDIQRGLEVIEFACGIPHALKGEYTQGAGPGIDVYSMRQPLGVVAGITPFNFPGMIPMWMFGMAIAAGNTFILKPSERDPSLPVRLGELMMEAGAPKGVLNVVHGDKVAVDAILTHPDVHAVSFVGSSDIAHYVYQMGAQHGKRVQAMGGAKNHGIVLPDADMDQVIKDLTWRGLVRSFWAFAWCLPALAVTWASWRLYYLSRMPAETQVGPDFFVKLAFVDLIGWLLPLALLAVLAVRLFANMMAGHTVLGVILGFIAQTADYGFLWYAVTPVSIVAQVFIGLLELFVAFLQAYVFAFLASLFIGTAVNPH